jgi:hypothetical protein
MNINNLHKAIKELYPNSEYAFNGSDLAKGLSWRDDTVSFNESDFMNKYEELQLNDLREVRNAMLAETDWTQLGDVSEGVKSAWQPYRQALRDITESCTSLDDVEWPEKP